MRIVKAQKNMERKIICSCIKKIKIQFNSVRNQYLMGLIVETNKQVREDDIQILVYLSLGGQPSVQIL